MVNMVKMSKSAPEMAQQVQPPIPSGKRSGLWLHIIVSHSSLLLRNALVNIPHPSPWPEIRIPSSTSSSSGSGKPKFASTKASTSGGGGGSWGSAKRHVRVQSSLCPNMTHVTRLARSTAPSRCSSVSRTSATRCKASRKGGMGLAAHAASCLLGLRGPVAAMLANGAGGR